MTRERELEIELAKERSLSKEYASRLLRVIDYVKLHKKLEIDEFDILASPKILISIASGVDNT